MGMYDYINGEQVKCFYSLIPSISGNLLDDDFLCSGGNLINYKNGDKVPIEKLFYKYNKDLIILDNEIGNDISIHVIIDGVVYATYKDLKDFDFNEFDNIDFMVINYNGDKQLNIKTNEDIINYIEEYNELKCLEKKIRKLSRDLMGEIIDNRNNMSYLEFYDKMDKQEELFDLESKELEKYYKEFWDKWIIEDDCINEKLFGSYLDIIFRNLEEEYILKHFEFKIYELLKKDNQILEKYFKWKDFDDEFKQQLKYMVENVINKYSEESESNENE